MVASLLGPTARRTCNGASVVERVGPVPAVRQPAPMPIALAGPAGGLGGTRQDVGVNTEDPFSASSLAGSSPEASPSAAPSPAAELYDVMNRRRDVRSEFTGEPLPDETLRRVLAAAHSAPSVGLTQPWDFVVVRGEETRRTFREHVLAERSTFAAELSGERAQTFSKIKVEGIVESSLGVVVTYDPDRGAPAVLGRHAIADAGLYSVCLAIQNLWLAATAEGLGVGWVSFYREDFLRRLLDIPQGVRPVAWLCLGTVRQLAETPDLERHGWRKRLPLEDLVHHEKYRRGRSR